MSNNKLILNGEKTHVMVMTSSRKHAMYGDFGITLDTGTESVEPVSDERLLGANISNDLTWKKHIQVGNSSLIAKALIKIERSR